MGIEETPTQTNKALVTNKTLYKDEKILDITDNTNTLANKRRELNSHFALGDDNKFDDYAKLPMNYEKNSWKKDNQDDKTDHMQSNIFHSNTTQKRDMNKVNEEKKKQKDFETNYSKFD